ncbi:MAG: S46 family peptidase [Sphingomicrobium sp.]
MRYPPLLVTASLLAASFAAAPASAEEGMWTFDGFPAAKMRAEYGWAPDQKWLDRVRNAAVRLTGGCSASFVSPSGLILTNHHCVATCIQNNSTAENDLLNKGFAAAARTDERKCPGQQAEVVTSISDVTGEVKAAIGVNTGEALTKARDARIAELEKAGCSDTATTRCQVVGLFGGGQYKLYKYRKFSDVRLVWAPEDRAATFGGDPDNFNFPRWSLDFSLMRVYENGKPARTPDYLRWRPEGPRAGDPVFVPGHPGSTSRLLTLEQLKFNRSVTFPQYIARNSELRGRLIEWGKTGDEPKRIVQENLLGLENSLKVYRGLQSALLDDRLMDFKTTRERELR